MQEQGKIPLSPFLASMEFHALCGRVSFRDLDTPFGKERLIVVHGTTRVFTTHQPSHRSNSWEIDGNPRFWEEVRQLSFNFEDGKWEKIREFYTRYGPVKPVFLTPSGGIDLVPSVRNALLWFLHLTNLASWVKNGKLPPLREFFDGDGHAFFQLFSFGVSRVKPVNFPQEGNGHLENTPGLNSFFKDTLGGTLAVSNALWATIQESTAPALLGKELIERSAKARTLKDNELISHTWGLIASTVGAKLGTIEFVPVHQQVTKSIPPVVWYFRAYCALDAAFLQWYLQEIAPLRVKTCEAPGCNNPVLNSRAKYCSLQCKWKTQKRRQRERKRAKSNLTGSGG
jgi:hypothetical protein